MTRLILVANPEEFHVGGHLLAAARHLDVTTEVADVRSARGGRWRQAVWWRLFDHRLVHMGAFERHVRSAVEQFRPDVLLATGLSPLRRQTLSEIGRRGVRRVNYLTDDPWNPAHHCRWFLE